MSVVLHHTPLADAGGPLKKGFLGVDLFFVLSGFLIVTLLLRERDRTGTVSLRKFYARRMLRILPIYYLMILVVLFLYSVTNPTSLHAREYYQSLPFLLTYTSNWVHLHAGNMVIMWSLAAEEQFYLGWPMVEKFLRPVGVAVILVAVIIVNQLINFGVVDGVVAKLYGGHSRLQIVDVTFTPIGLGVLLAHLLHARRTFGASYWLLGHRWSSLVFGAGLMALIAFWPGDLAGFGRLLIQVAMVVVLGALVVREDHWARPVLTFQPLAYLGMISYGIYVYHMWVIHLVRIGFERLGGNPAGIEFFVVALVASAVVASLSYRYIEHPIRNLKADFASAGKAPVGDVRATRRMAESVA